MNKTNAQSIIEISEIADYISVLIELNDIINYKFNKTRENGHFQYPKFYTGQNLEQYDKQDCFIISKSYSNNLKRDEYFNSYFESIQKNRETRNSLHLKQLSVKNGSFDFTCDDITYFLNLANHNNLQYYLTKEILNLKNQLDINHIKLPTITKKTFENENSFIYLSKSDSNNTVDFYITKDKEIASFLYENSEKFKFIGNYLVLKSNLNNYEKDILELQERVNKVIEKLNSFDYKIIKQKQTVDANWMGKIKSEFSFSILEQSLENKSSEELKLKSLCLNSKEILSNFNPLVQQLNSYLQNNHLQENIQKTGFKALI